MHTGSAGRTRNPWIVRTLPSGSIAGNPKAIPLGLGALPPGASEGYPRSSMNETYRAWRLPSLREHWLGGKIRTIPEEFRVEEIPLYEPDGQGEHLYLRVQKRDQTTDSAVRSIARGLGISGRQIGVAGRKDKRAVSIQTISVPARCEEAVSTLNLPGIEILTSARHSRKIRPGHLAGNRFQITLRDPEPTALIHLPKTAALVIEQGVPNYFGDQRFGTRLNNHRIGAALLVSRWEIAAREIAGRPCDLDRDRRVWEARRCFDEARYEEAKDRYPRTLSSERSIVRHLARQPDDFQGAIAALSSGVRRFYLNAWQSYIFNRFLEENLDRLSFFEAGDVALKPSGVAFTVDDALEAREREEAGEIARSGPLPGYRSMIATGVVGEFERRLVGESLGGFDGEIEPIFRRLKLRGDRRSLVLRPRELTCETEGDRVHFRFMLPAGAFATTVLSAFTGPGSPICRLESTSLSNCGVSRNDG